MRHFDMNYYQNRLNIRQKVIHDKFSHVVHKVIKNKSI